MEWKSNIRRTQSLRSFHSSCDKPIWTDVGLRDKTTSVSQLVARYQTTVKVNKSIQGSSVDHDEGKPNHVLKEITPSRTGSKETHLESLMKRNAERERSRAKSNLTRSTSMGSLKSSTGSIEALRLLFESTASAQNKGRSSLSAADFTSDYMADVSKMNGEVEDVKSATETRADNAAKAGVKDGHLTRKEIVQTQTEKRRTVGGIDFEKIAASQADEKRRSAADFRDRSFIQTKEKLSVSVKAISALYLSKVAPEESASSLLKLEQDQSHESGKRVNLTKMAEDSTVKQRKDDRPPTPSPRHQPELEESCRTHSLQLIPTQRSKEMLYQQRQKCELRRLLKHTRPELKMLDDAVDEELAEVLSSEAMTADETGYEGEVLSKRLIFENCGLSSKVSHYSPKMHTAERSDKQCDFSKTLSVLEGKKEKPHAESVKEVLEVEKSLSFSPDSDRECEEQMAKIDVQATRRIFESQSVNTSRPNLDDKFQGKVSIYRGETKEAQKQKKQFEMGCSENLQSKNKSTDLETEPHEQVLCTCVDQRTDFSCSDEVSTEEALFEKKSTSLPDSEKNDDVIKTRAALFQNNPFIATNMEREHSFVHIPKSQITARECGAGEENMTTNVKNRTHLFESMPFDKIRRQNEDEIETMVENIKETLNFLYQVKAIQSTGSIIEVNETMIAKKASFTLSKSGPEIKHNEVAEGGAQNFILQLLPRVNLKPQVTYLKENSKGAIETTLVTAPVQQHQFDTNKDKEFKTASVVQLVEDILNQDNSLRKGVVIQEDDNNCAKVIVYSLYKYHNEKDVKSFISPNGAEYDQSEVERGHMSKTGNKEITVATKSIKGGLLELSQEETCPGSIMPEGKVKGSVKLFKSCIEKGDFEYLKSLQADEAVQELSENQTMAGQDTERLHEKGGEQLQQNETTCEWVPVDVKRLKSMFSGYPSQLQPKKKIHENVSTSQNLSAEHNSGVLSHVQVKDTNNEYTDQAQEQICYSKVVPQESDRHFEIQDDELGVHQAQLVQVVDDNEQISNLQTANHSLQQATTEEAIASVIADTVKHSREEAEISQENLTSGHKTGCQHKNTEDATSGETQTTETCSKKGQEGTEVVLKQPTETAMVATQSLETTPTQQEDEEVVFHGKIKASLESLERANINITRGGFRAAMIYRNSSKPQQEKSHVDVESIQTPSIIQELCTVNETEATQVPLNQEVIGANAESPHQNETPSNPATSFVSEKSKRPSGPKPAIPPKPERLKVKRSDNQSNSTKNLEGTQNNTGQPKEMVPPVAQPKTLIEQDLSKSKSGTCVRSDSVQGHQRNQPLGEAVWMSQETTVRHQIQGDKKESDNIDKNIMIVQQEMNAKAEEKSTQDSTVKSSETDESHVDFHDAFEKFGGKKTAPVKPKRVKIAQLDIKNLKPMAGDKVMPDFARVDPDLLQITSNQSCGTCGETADSKDKHEKEIKKQESKVEMREKKGRTETEDERRQRLSVHMDEIMRGNLTAAMEIFDNLRKQQELQSILSRVEEIEKDTSEVDVRSLRRVFENVPDWIVSSDKKKQNKVRADNRDERLSVSRESTESKSSVAHVFGDLERASVEIMNLKEQTLARLLDVEEAIKKALFSVSALKSDSDIAGLSCLFKESIGAVQGSPSSSSINKISRSKSQQVQKSATIQGNTAISAGQDASIDGATAKPQSSPPSSPAFISIQSLARKTDKTDLAPTEILICPTCQQCQKLEETFRTTKTLICNSPAQNRRDPRKGGQKESTSSPLSTRQVSVLEVQTGCEENSVTGKNNHEKIDNSGKKLYSSETSTVVNTQPDTMTSSARPVVISPATHQVTTNPDVKLPINQTDNLVPK
ncbi:xin actin-binding repeat-containing protein 1 [Archocentrus centrarchus]|uniref:xin actin-binding repeat-containing protein 1 n=1 Tax=Archocentrus centrarchus TaxID=63155 RepID=UPI0011EA2A74|nr:xin actin-binding repeat-containing protein 1-like [Archocentrus centrarchus]